jgi:hypothetical protein
LNFPATCCAGGAKKWRAEHAAFLRGANVLILPDNDDIGREHMNVVAASLQGIAASIRVLELPDLPPKGDIIDWVSAGGKDALANLQEAFADKRQLHPKDADKLPLVSLSGDHYSHPEYGRVETPVFDIERWVDPPGGMKAIKPPAPASTFLAIEHNSGSYVESDGEPDLGRSQPAERTAPDKESGSRFADFEENIPF